MTVRAFTLRSPLVELRAPDTSDVEAIVAACHDPETVRWTTVPAPYDRSDAAFFLDRIVDHGWATGREMTWGLRTPGSSELVGVVSVRTAGRDVGFWTAPAARGRGLMTEAVRLVVDWALGEGGLPEVRWEAHVGNVASAAVARRVGFRYLGAAPGLHPGRDGEHPLCWTARLGPDDDREPAPGWPVPLTGEFPGGASVGSRADIPVGPGDRPDAATPDPAPTPPPAPSTTPPETP
ncbi:GNAT family N-acetyltransferase [Frigoribacterium sp. NBH87]|nr:GNAT family N-acetyltransferase [Frigoribacterium sp. NBH87]